MSEESRFTSKQICALITVINILISYKLQNHYSSLEEKQTLLLKNLNVTGNSADNILVFNRVPKTGSTSFVKVLEQMGTINNFSSNSYMVRDKVDTELTTMDESVRQNVAYDISFHYQNSSHHKNAYFKHMHFINFEDYGYQSPIYINLVRHPVERFQSWFYYVRSTNMIVAGVSKTVSVPTLKMTLDDCLLGRKPCGISLNHINETEMINNILAQNNEQSLLDPYSKVQISKIIVDPDPRDDHGRLFLPNDAVNSQMQYFCGYGIHCDMVPRSNQVMVFQRARKNLDRYFSVVGVLEDMDISTQVFENYIPNFFKGLSTINQHKVNQNKPKPELSNEARVLLEEYLDYEILFYQYCRQRLYKQYKALSLQ